MADRHLTPVPDMVLRKVEALGSVGQDWLRDLDAILGQLELAWSVAIGPPLEGGSAAYVASAQAADGRQAVCKVAMPDGLAGNSPFEQELRALELAQGLGYVELLAVSPDRRAILLERLGRPLSALGLSAERQIEIITDTVSQGWRAAPAAMVMRDGATQARWLAEFITATWEELSRPCSEAQVELTHQFAAHRASSVPAHPVVIHGDAHPDNVLQVPGRPGLFKLIDPDAMLSDPAHELGIMLRDWSEELLAGDPLTTGQAWCRATAAEIGALAQAVWEWAYLERMSTGLFMAKLGLGRGRYLLEVAARWAEAPRISP